MKKLFIFGDVHSFYNEWMDCLKSAGFEKDNHDHILVSLGDLCDRGKDAVKCLKFINSIPEERKICVIGNHEFVMEEMIKRGMPFPNDYSNGTLDTVEQLTCIYGHPESAILDMRDNSLWNNYKKSWVFYAEVGDNIFVHGWIPCMLNTRFTNASYEYMKNWRKAYPHKFKEASWVNGMRAWNDGVRENGKTIFCGHWYTSYGHANLRDDGVESLDNKRQVESFKAKHGEEAEPYVNYDPFVDEGIMALDGCTPISKKVNVYALSIADEVFDRYLRENKRNF